MMMSKVSIVKCETYDKDEVYAAVVKACESAKFPDVLDKKVLIKPNILSDSPVEKAITTNPEVLRAMIKYVKSQGAKSIIVGDSPALHKPGLKPTTCGLYQICEEEDVEWVSFIKDSFKVKLPILKHKITLTSVLNDVDLLISLPKLKTHELMITTGALKNQFGLVPGLHKSPQHVKYPKKGNFAKLICGIHTQSKAKFALMDAVIGMEGAGPGNGTPRQIGVLIASNDLLAVDIAQATIMGHSPMDIPIIKCGIKNHITKTKKLDNIKYTDIDANDIIIKDFKRIVKDKKTELDNRVTPTFIHKKCVLCKKCIKVCPAGALSVVDKKIKIDEEKCVSCYCCHEVCPKKAIEIRK
jgi:uncharacterized protein (DUF362 family)